MRIPFVLALTLLLTAPVAVAKDHEEEGRVRDAEALVKRIEEGAEKKDRPRLVPALKEVPDLHNALKTKAAMGKLRKAVAAVLADEHQGVAVRVEAVRVLGALYDERGAWKSLAPFLPMPKEEAAGLVGVAVLEAVAEVAPAGAIKKLETLSRTAKDAQVARLAIRALGRYGYSKKRESVLKSLTGTLVRLRPGVVKGPRGQPDRQRYDALRGALVAALNDLTGRRVEGVDLWLELMKEHKKTPEKLFLRER